MQLGVSLGIPYTLGKPAAAFSPLDLSPVLWLDASDTSTITESGGSVSQWDDKSGNANHVTQATAVLQPTTGTRTINGLNVLDFAFDYMEVLFAAAITQPGWLFVVVSADNAANTYDFIDDPTLASGNGWHLYQQSNAYKFDASTRVSTISGGTTSTNPVLLGAEVNGASSSLRVDGTQVTTGNAGTKAANGVSVGASYNGSNALDGAIAEVIIVDGTLTAGEIAATESYLADKWGITI